MGLETGSFIPELDQSNPDGVDPKSEGDNHLRLIKVCVQGSFPAFVGTTAVPAFVGLTEDQLSDAALKSEANVFSENNQFTASGLNTTTGGLVLISPNVALITQNTDAPIGEQIWLADVNNVGSYRIRTRNDGQTSGNIAIGIDRSSTLVDAVTLYQGAGLKRLSTAASGALSLLSDGNTDAEARRLNFAHQDGTIRALIGFTSTDEFRLRNDVDGGDFGLFGRDSGNTARTYLFANADAITELRGVTETILRVGIGADDAVRAIAGGAVESFFNNIKRLSTRSTGAIEVRADGDTDTENCRVELIQQGGLLKAHIGFPTTSSLRFDNRILLGTVVLRGRDAGNLVSDFFIGTPDGNTLIQGDTDVFLRPLGGAAEGIVITGGGAVNLYADNANVAQTISPAAGGLQVDNQATGAGTERVLTTSDLIPSFGGFVDAAATAEVLPSGWTAVKNSSGNYTITHNLGLANANDLAISATILDATLFGDQQLLIDSVGVNSFVIETSVLAAPFDQAFMFTAIDTTKLQ